MSSPEVGANVGPCSQMLYIKNIATQLLTIKTFVLQSIISVGI
jgi:hypothetical protein